VTRLTVADLFCGGGGFSTGFLWAVVDRNREAIATATGLDADEITPTHPAVQGWLAEHVRLVAVNHWDPAVETYRANHEWATVHNAKVQSLYPPDAVDGHDVDALIAGPSCLPWTKAGGGVAKDDQKRMSPRHVAHWIELLRPDQFLLENVQGFRRWGPIEIVDSEPEPTKDGSLFEDWLGTLRALGYTVDWRTCVAADYGDPQTRKRLFVQGRLEYEPAWPAPTHSEDGAELETESWRPAAEIIDWSDPGRSLWTRDRDHPRVHTPPSATTLARIAQGVRRYCDERLDPFADAIADLTPADIERLRETAVPASDAATAAHEREKPFLVAGARRQADAEPAECGLCVPYVLGQQSGAVARDATTTPASSVTTDGFLRVFSPEAFVLPRNQRQRGDFSNGARDPDAEPLHTVTAQNHDGHLVAPYLVPFYGERPGQAPRTHDIKAPLPSVPASKVPAGLCEPFLRVYNGNSDVAPIDAPCPSVTATDRLALCVPACYPWGLDIRFRLLKPVELKQAQGFPADYELAADTKDDRTTLIGNAVPVGMARALSRALLAPTERPTLAKFGEPPTGVTSDDD